MIIVDSVEDIDKKWPAFIAGKPDFVKIFLLYSEEHEKRKGDASYDYRRGLDPKLARPVAERARAAGLEVSAHVYTASDFRTAVEAGATQIVHLPGVGYDKDLGLDAFRINDEDAAMAAKATITVISTLTGLVEDLKGAPEVKSYFEDVVRSNFQTLRVAGVAGAHRPRISSGPPPMSRSAICPSWASTTTSSSCRSGPRRPPA